MNATPIDCPSLPHWHQCRCPNCEETVPAHCDGPEGLHVYTCPLCETGVLSPDFEVAGVEKKLRAVEKHVLGLQRLVYAQGEPEHYGHLGSALGHTQGLLRAIHLGLAPVAEGIDRFSYDDDEARQIWAKIAKQQ